MTSFESDQSEDETCRNTGASKTHGDIYAFHKTVLKSCPELRCSAEEAATVRIVSTRYPLRICV
jgi:hypothetical protein